MGKKLDLRGVRFGRLTVIEEAGRSCGHVAWRCKCDCGNECVVSSNHLRLGRITSCGCFNRERVSEVNTTHGMRRHPLYNVWQDLLKRCGVHKGASDRQLQLYAERGITVCDEWKTFENFYDWAIAHGYSEGLELDRIDNDRGYCPDNCRFVTHKQNCNNRRCTLRLSDGTSLAEFVSSFGIETFGELKCSTNAYKRVLYAFKNHGEHSAITTVFDIALEQIANNTGFEYVKNAIVHI